MGERLIYEKVVPWGTDGKAKIDPSQLNGHRDNGLRWEEEEHEDEQFTIVRLWSKDGDK